MCVFMSPGRLSWLHKIELVISNISSPKGDWVGEEEQGRAGDGRILPAGNES